MSNTVKGLLKGLRYISQIFEEKEEEIQIGFPTDVKHVAHIGSDDPGANAPSWMTEFKPGEGPSSGTTTPTTNAPEKVEEPKNSKDSKSSKIKHLIPKSKHNSTDNDSSPRKHKQRRHRSSDSNDGSVHESSSGGSRHRRHRRGSNHGSVDCGESASQELPPTGSKPRRKTKSVEEGAERKKDSSKTSRRSKGDSLTDIPVQETESESKVEEVK